MKILIVIDTFYPTLRGGELVIWRFSRELARRGHQVSVITGRLPDTKAHERIHGLDIYRPVALEVSGKSQNLNMILGKVKFLSSLYGVLKTFIKKHRPDVIYNQAYTVTLPVCLAANKFKVPLVTGIGTFQQNQHFKTSRWWVALAQKYKEQFIIRASRQYAVRVGGDWLNRVVAPMTPSRVFTLPSPVDDEAIRAIPTETNPERQRKVLDIEKGRRFLLHVGVLEKVKNLEPLLRGLAGLTMDFKLVLAGDGSQMEPLEALVDQLDLNERVLFLGRIPNTEVLNLMQAADTLVLSSLSEVAPTVIIEALSCGTPVVTTRVGNVDELVSKNLTIVDHAHQIPEVLARGIEAKADPDFIHRYSVAACTDGFEQLFRRATTQTEG